MNLLLLIVGGVAAYFAVSGRYALAVIFAFLFCLVALVRLLEGAPTRDDWRDDEVF